MVRIDMKTNQPTKLEFREYFQKQCDKLSLGLMQGLNLKYLHKNCHVHWYWFLNILFYFPPDGYFEGQSICFCSGCHKARGDESYLRRGDPPKDFVLPFGWCRYVLRSVKSFYSMGQFTQFFLDLHFLTKNLMFIESKSV